MKQSMKAVYNQSLNTTGHYVPRMSKNNNYLIPALPNFEKP
jgi:hypothetical protein